jgi:hypothetical protein
MNNVDNMQIIAHGFTGIYCSAKWPHLRQVTSVTECSDGRVVLPEAFHVSIIFLLCFNYVVQTFHTRTELQIHGCQLARSGMNL